MVIEVLIAWLNDAYAMEQTQIQALEQLSTDFEHYPEIRGELRQHVLETHQQVAAVEACIRALGGTTTDTSVTNLQASGISETITTSTHNDELVKHLLLLHANERFEQGTYLALAEAARIVDEDDIADTCERIAEEECAMAEWAEEQIPLITTAYMLSAREEV